MTKSIRIKRALLEIPFVDDDGNEIIKFEYDTSDSAKEKVFEVQDELMKTVAKAEKDDNYTIEKLNRDVKKAFDSLLGEGSYDKLYQLSPSWEIMIHYFIEICATIGGETGSNLDEMNQTIEKYSNQFTVK